MIRLYSISLLFAIAVAAPLFAQEVPLGTTQQKITAVSAVRARTGPQVGAQEITRLRLGTVVDAVARSAEQSEIGGKTDYWYRVALPGGEPGWIFGGLLQEYDPARRQAAIDAIIEDRLKIESMTFEDGVDFYNFVAGELDQIEAPGEVRGRLELMRLHALSRAVGAISGGEQVRPPYRDFSKAHAEEIYYHELAGIWAVRPDAFWDLERRYHGSLIGERIAWDAAQALRGGECESDEVCNFLDLCETQGRYLRLYPDGEHASEAIRNITESLASEDVSGTLAGSGGDKYLVAERKAVKKAVAELRPVVAKTKSPEKDELLKLLGELAPGR